MDFSVVLVLLASESVLVGLLLCLLGLPVGAHVIDLALVIELGVVVFADATEALPEGKMLLVDGHTVVFTLATRADVLPSSLLLLEVETGGVREEDGGDEHAAKTEPWDDVELLLRSDVVVQHGREEGTALSDGGRETVSSGTNRCGEHFSGDEEGDSVRTELVEERGEEVHGLEGVDTFDAGVVLVVEGWNDEQDEVHQESELLHPLATVVLVVDKEG